MFKFTIIAALAIASMSFVDASEKVPTEQKEKNGNHPKGKDAKSNHGNKGDDNERVKVFPSGNDQQGNKKVKQGPKNQGGPMGFGKKQGPENDGSKNKSNNPFDKHKQQQNGPFVKQDKGHGKTSAKSHKADKLSSEKKGSKDKDKHGKTHYDKGHPNFGYVYVNKHGYYSHSNYGQWRSLQAKKKHKHYHPLHQAQAVEGFNLIIVRNRFLFTETDYKINLIRVRLAERRNANRITVVEYNQMLSRVVVLEKRRAALEINIEL